MQTREKDYRKENEKYLKGLSPKMRGFYKQTAAMFPHIRLTSGRRVRKEGDEFSHHHTGNAIDFGKEAYDVYHYFMNNKEGLQMLVDYGYGIIDETNPQELIATKATAPIFHIGPDSNYKNIPVERLKNYDTIEEKVAFYAVNPLYDYSAITKPEGSKSPDKSENILNHQQEYFHEFNNYFRDPETTRAFVTDLYEGQKKEEIKEEKEEKVPARKDLREGTDKLNRIEMARRELQTIRAPKPQQREARRPVEEDPMHEIQIQRSLPELQSLFTMPKFEDGGEVDQQMNPEPVRGFIRDVLKMPQRREYDRAVKEGVDPHQALRDLGVDLVVTNKEDVKRQELDKYIQERDSGTSKGLLTLHAEDVRAERAEEERKLRIKKEIEEAKKEAAASQRQQNLESKREVVAPTTEVSVTEEGNPKVTEPSIGLLSPEEVANMDFTGIGQGNTEGVEEVITQEKETKRQVTEETRLPEEGTKYEKRGTKVIEIGPTGEEKEIDYFDKRFHKINYGLINYTGLNDKQFNIPGREGVYTYDDEGVFYQSMPGDTWRQANERTQNALMNYKLTGNYDDMVTEDYLWKRAEDELNKQAKLVGYKDERGLFGKGVGYWYTKHTAGANSLPIEQKAAEIKMMLHGFYGAVPKEKKSKNKDEIAKKFYEEGLKELEGLGMSKEDIKKREIELKKVGIKAYKAGM